MKAAGEVVVMGYTSKRVDIVERAAPSHFPFALAPYYLPSDSNNDLHFRLWRLERTIPHRRISRHPMCRIRRVHPQRRLQPVISSARKSIFTADSNAADGVTDTRLTTAGSLPV